VLPPPVKVWVSGARKAWPSKNTPAGVALLRLTFGTDTSLTTGPGWDNLTGVGTPDGWNFVNALAP